MTDQVLPIEGQPLSQGARVLDTFIAPTKTFTDILRSTSWWLPFLLMVIVSFASAYAIDKNVGFDRVAEQQVEQSPSQADRLAQLTPDARAQQMHGRAVGTKYSTYASGVFILLIAAIFALLNWAGLNFGLGAKTTFGQNFAVAMYSSLPRLFIGLLNIVFLYAGVNTENFDLNNPVAVSYTHLDVYKRQLYEFAKRKFEELGEEQIRPPLLLTGEDLIAAGYKPGPGFRQMLTLAEDAQLEGTITTREEALELVRRQTS